MQSLKVYSIKERKPKNGEDIFLWGERDSYGDSYLDAKIETVEYRWAEQDNEGFTGDEVIYEEGVKPEALEGCELVLIMLDSSGEEIEDDYLYSRTDHIVKMMINKK